MKKSILCSRHLSRQKLILHVLVGDKWIASKSVSHRQRNETSIGEANLHLHNVMLFEDIQNF